MRWGAKIVAGLVLACTWAPSRGASSESARVRRPAWPKSLDHGADGSERTRPPEASVDEPMQPRPLRLVVISDLNSSYGSVRYASAVHAASKALVERIQPDLVLITGDMVAGQKRGLDYRAMWRAFHASVTDPLLEADIAVAPTPGNHDAAPGFEVERREYVAQWTDPGRVARVRYVDGSHYPIYYSFEHGGVFFASVDATAVGPLRGRQRAWLDEQLSATDADVRIVFGHLPNHPFAKRRENEILDDRELERILQRHAVDAYISGHHHAYYPGAVDGVRHVAMPCLGGGPRSLIGRSQRSGPALLMIEIDATGITSLEAMHAPDFDAVVERKSLPRRIEHRRHTVSRDDLAPLGPGKIARVLARTPG